MIAPKAPMRWVAGHVVYGADGFSDPWTLFRVPLSDYDGRSKAGKEKIIRGLLEFAHHVGHDFQLLKLSSFFDRQSYVHSRRRGSMHQLLRDQYVSEHAEELHGLVMGEQQLFVAVSQRPPSKSRKEKAADPWAMVKRRPSRELESVLSREDRDKHQRIADDEYRRLEPYLTGMRPASSEEIQWIVRRMWSRGLGEPIVDAVDELQAPVVVDRSGREVLMPQETDLLRWTGGVQVNLRDLEIHGEDESGYQAALVVSRLPMTDEAPTDMLEIAFRPLTRLEFPVDMTVTCEWISNKRALEETETAITDADEDAMAENDSERGASDEAAERPELARDQRLYLRQSRAPMLNATIVAHIAGRTKDELKDRLTRAKQTFEDNDAQMQRPPMQQLQAFFDGFPGQRTNLAGYRRRMTCEQLGAQGWTATNMVGSRSGWLLGRTLTATGMPVRFDPRDGSRENRAAAIALLGDLGSGKTALAQKLMYEAVLDGAYVVDRDPKGDHRWHELLPEDAVESITLNPSPELRGLLDPWINAPAELRVAAAQTFLMALFPRGASAEWETALMRALHVVAEREEQPSNSAVLKALRSSADPIAVRAAEHLETYAQNGLTQLGFADPTKAIRELGRRQVTYVLTARLPIADAKRSRGELTPAEIQGEQISTLLALLSMRLTAEKRASLKIQNSDESWRDLKTNYGRDELDAQQRMGRSELAVPIIATQTPSNIGQGDDAVTNLFGAYFLTRPNNEDDARRMLQVAQLDPENERKVSRLMALESGQALFVDHFRRSEFIEVFQTPSFMRQISTTPDVDRELAVA